MDLEENLSKQEERRLPHHLNQRRFRRFAITFATATTIAYLASLTSAESVSAQEKTTDSFDLDKLFSLKTEESKEISIDEMLSEVQEKQRLKKEKEEREKKLLEVKAKIEQRERMRVQAAAIKTAKMEAEEREKKARQEAQRQLFTHCSHQRNILALMIDAEAELSEEDMIRVGSVILNRVRTTYSDFDSVNSITEVLYQVVGGHRQYDSYTIRVVESGRQPSEEALRIANGLLDGTIQILPEKILYQTTYKQGWMHGKIADANLPNAAQFYGYPLDFEEKCRCR